jgi:retron-type reverse transcriptase
MLGNDPRGEPRQTGRCEGDPRQERKPGASGKANRGSGGVDGQSLDGFAAQLDQQLDRLQSELTEDVYRAQPVRQVQIPKAGKPGEFRTLGIPTIYDRVCQQALLNRLEPIFEPVFDAANFGYRRGRSTKDAMRKVWKEITGGREWIVDAGLKDFFGSVDRPFSLADPPSLS